MTRRLHALASPTERGARPERPTLVGRLLSLAAALVAFVGCGGSAHPGYLSDDVPATDAALDTRAGGDAAGAFDAADVADAADAASAPDAADASADAPPSTGLNVLFIGNSYTYVNDLPATLHGLAVAAGDDPAIAVSSVVVGGYTLQNHWEGPDAQPAIAKGGLTHVVLQGQSAEPVGDPANFEVYAKLFAAAVTAAHARPVFFETWARKAGCTDYVTYPWLGATPDVMQDSLSREYVAMAAATAAKLAPVGEAFREVWTLHPSIELYQGDGSHPTVAGTYLAACVFYDVLTGRTFLVTGGVPGGVSDADATVLRSVAAHAVATH